MSKIHQIQLRYDPLEDRALLRLTTTDEAEFRFWVTRRYARLLNRALTGCVARSARVLGQPEPAAREAVMAFEHESAVSRADFVTRFRDAPRPTPLGDAPVLLAQVKCTPLKDGLTLLGMHPVAGQGVELRLDAMLLHSMLKLVADAARAGEWDLAPDLPATTAPAPGKFN